QGFGGGNDLVSSTPGLGAGWLLQTGLLSGGTATLFKDGTQIAQFTHNYNTTLSRLVIGEELNNLGFIGIEVAAVLVYDRSLSTAERQEVDAYLTEKYVAAIFDIKSIPDPWKEQYFGTIDIDPLGDADADGLTNLQEYQRGTDPTHADTDGGGMI